MFRVLIVDDEEPVLDSFAFLLDTHCADFTLAGKARSGYEAIRLMHELKPDVVFMDINIPGIDGMEVIAEVHPAFPGTVFILSTAYERFDIAQRAIPLGIFAYLVKPVSKKTFLSTLDSVRHAFRKRETPAHIRPTNLAERQFLREAIWKAMSPADWEYYRELFSFHSDKGIVCLVDLEGDATLWCAEIAGKLAFRHRCLFTMHLGLGLYFIPEDVDRPALVSLLDNIIGETVPAQLVRARSVGQAHASGQLYLSSGEAMDELRRSKALASPAERGRVQAKLELGIMQLRRHMGILPLEELRGLFDSIWKDIFTSNDFTIAKARMVGLFTLLLDEASGRPGKTAMDEPAMDPAAEIMLLPDMAAWAAWSLQAFNALQSCFALRRAGHLPLPLLKAIEYIDSHYAEQVQLSDAAEAAAVSNAYLSRLFAEHLNTPFVDYLTELRVAQAKRLIRESGMNIKEIAFSVGYQDPNYFSKIFRKATGESPTVYATAIRAAALDAVDSCGEPEKDGS